LHRLLVRVAVLAPGRHEHVSHRRVRGVHLPAGGDARRAGRPRHCAVTTKDLKLRPSTRPPAQEGIMRRPRFTIANLLVVVLSVAVAVAALRAAEAAWDSGTFALTLLALLSSTLLAVHRTGRSRAFWLGFALFGWASLIASLIPPVESRLPTT